MTIHLAVRLPDELVEYVDVPSGDGDDARVAVVTRALHLLRQQQAAERSEAYGTAVVVPVQTRAPLPSSARRSRPSPLAIARA